MSNNSLTPRDAAACTVNLALGRIFRLMSRSEEAGDIAEYERCRAIILTHVEAPVDRTLNWARDRLKGAQGD